MAHFAEIKSSDNKVLRVVKIDNDDVANNDGEYSTEAETWVANFIPNDPFILEEYSGNYPATYWKQTSYNANERGVYAGVDFTFHADENEFRRPQPFSSWTWDSTNKVWTPPIPFCENTDEGATFWDEENQRWKNGEGTKYWDGSAWQNV